MRAITSCLTSIKKIYVIAVQKTTLSAERPLLGNGAGLVLLSKLYDEGFETEFRKAKK